ncbi:MAG TPA: YeeE/YedE thiosulfate transporter family protein [Vicinamibacterales bacterium]|nr:YeeE/YedE thiosulfate transporter family protein [Vicinamibacterales bacterium]
MNALLLALAIGVGFGAALEQAGLGSAKKLTGQFYLKDLTVFKVMFSAIVTAMLGVFWLARLGWIDLAAIAVPETYLRPQLAGGLIFGAGFALAGLCPGTSCVAAASGRGDGAAVAAGLFTGVLAAGFSFPVILNFYDSDARGVWTLPSLLHLPYGLVVFAIVLIALGGFAAAERLEARG